MATIDEVLGKLWLCGLVMGASGDFTDIRGTDEYYEIYIRYKANAINAAKLAIADMGLTETVCDYPSGGAT